MFVYSITVFLVMLECSVYVCVFSQCFMDYVCVFCYSYADYVCLFGSFISGCRSLNSAELNNHYCMSVMV